jgi:drug/metabolite transporter (DMT)-like permease
MTIDNFVGLIVLLYGIGKVCISIMKALPKEYDKTFYFIKHDRTTAGYVLDGVLFIFGVYSILHGLRLLEHLHPTHADILTNIHGTIGLYTIMGIFLLMFYSIVLYTPYNVSKDENERPTYELLGLGGGFMFLLSVCILLIWHIYFNNITFKFIRKSHSLLFLIILTCVLTFVNGMLVHKHLVGNKDNGIDNVKSIVVDLMMMPLASVA